MPHIKTDSLKAGMTVHSDVLNADQMLLIPKGSVLSERQIGILQAWGVESVEVQDSGAGAEGDAMSALTPEERERLKAEVTGCFWRADEKSPVFLELVKLMMQRRLRIEGGKR